VGEICILEGAVEGMEFDALFDATEGPVEEMSVGI
jgi:hypothetical protein